MAIVIKRHKSNSILFVAFYKWNHEIIQVKGSKCNEAMKNEFIGQDQTTQVSNASTNTCNIAM